MMHEGSCQCDPEEVIRTGDHQCLIGPKGVVGVSGVVYNKLCTRCGEMKPIEEFGIDSQKRDSRCPQCKTCRRLVQRQASKEFRIRNPEYYQTDARRESARKSVAMQREDPKVRADRVDQERARRYARLYDMRIEDYDLLLEFQEGVCAICFRPPKVKRLAVDHDHKTGEVRGLLCNRCNQTLNNRVNIDWLFHAYAYLDVPPVHEALGRTPIGIKGSIKKRRRRWPKK